MAPAVSGQVVSVGVTFHARRCTRCGGLRGVAQGGQRGDRWPILCVIESTKAVSELYAPVSGNEVNDAVLASPGLVNDDPYAQGWMLHIEMSNASELDGLLTQAATWQLGLSARRCPGRRFAVSRSGGFLFLARQATIPPLGGALESIGGVNNRHEVQGQLLVMCGERRRCPLGLHNGAFGGIEQCLGGAHCLLVRGIEGQGLRFGRTGHCFRKCP